MSKFAQRVDIAVDALSSSPPKDVDDNDFIDASRLVYDGVREIRRAVLMNRVRIFHFHLVSIIFRLFPRPIQAFSAPLDSFVSNSITCHAK